MSKEELRQEHAPDEIRVEPWLAVMLLAIVPMLVAFAVGREYVMHLATVSGILFLAGTAMFVAHERRRR